MQAKYIDLRNEYDDSIFIELGQELKKGKIVVFKTDTVYGIGTNAFDKNACKRIYEIKGRPMYKPLSVLISDISMLKEIVDFVSPAEQKLIDVFWPGPLTIKFKKKANVLPDIVSAGDEYVRVRLLKNGPAYNLIKTAGIPIVAPSANLSGSPTGTNIKNIINELGEKVDYILDSGNVNNVTTSTIVEVANEKVIVIREGKIDKEEIARVVPLKN
ncbi:MAG: threonylcarbamoyl-AMP synthase [Clostridia bacterium]|nr:threonylcarbamoyl-AMP synthase [Clostridia bacterium]